MAFNRFESYVPIQWNLPKTDIGVLGNVLQAKQQRFDAGSELVDKLSQYSIDSLPQHRARANAIQQEWEQKEQGIVDKYGGDYASAYREIKGLASDIERQLRPGGEANALITQKKVFSDWYDTTAKDKEVNPESLNLGYNYYMNPKSKGYISDMKQDPVTGAWGIVTPEQIVGYTNPDDVALKAIKDLHPDKFSVEQDSVNGKWIVTDKQSGTVLRPEEIAAVVHRSLANDKNYFNSLRQTAKFKGEEGFDPNEYALGLAQGYGRDYSYQESESVRKLKGNDVWMHEDTEANKNRRQGQIMQQMNNMYYDKIGLDYGSIGEKGGLSFSDLEFNILGSKSENRGSLTSPTGLDFPSGKIIRSLTVDDLNKSIKDGTVTSLGGDGLLLEQILKDNAGTALQGLGFLAQAATVAKKPDKQNLYLF